MTSIQDSFDYIVVGAGSSGCVVASRLVKDHGATVLLLEQGPLDDSMFIRMPAGVFKIMFSNSPYIKRYSSAPQESLDGRSVVITQGNVVGGGSSVNVMAYVRGASVTTTPGTSCRDMPAGAGTTCCPISASRRA